MSHVEDTREKGQGSVQGCESVAVLSQGTRSGRFCVHLPFWAGKVKWYDRMVMENADVYAVYPLPSGHHVLGHQKPKILNQKRLGLESLRRHPLASPAFLRWTGSSVIASLHF